MKQRLDLEKLLRKYQSNYLLTDPYKETNLKLNRYETKTKFSKVKTQSNLFSNNDHYYNTNIVRSPQRQEYFGNRQSQKVVNLNFQMSKSECQNLLLSMRQELKSQQRSIQVNINSIVSQLMDKFERAHQDLRIQLLNLLEHSLDINRKMVLDNMNSMKNHSSKQYSAVYKKIANVDTDLSKLLAGLNSSDYKKTIAEVVTKDYIELLKSIKSDISTCNLKYKQNLKAPSADKRQIKLIQESFQHFYDWQQPRNYTEQKNVEELDLARMSRRSSKRRIFESRDKMALTQRQEENRGDRGHMRKTFFNFGQQY